MTSLPRRISGPLCLALLAACSPGPAAGPTPSRSAVDAVADEYYQAYLDARPLSAFLDGEPGTALDRLDRNSLADLARWQDEEDGWLARLRAIPASSLSGTPRVTYAILRTTLESAAARRVCRDELWGVTQLFGVQQLPSIIAQVQPVGTAELRSKALARYRSYGPFIDNEIARLREGVRQGYVAPRTAVEAVLEQLDGLLATSPDRSPVLVLAERDSAPGFRDGLVDVLRSAVYPALARYRDYLRAEYVARAREETAVAAMPRGEACYRARIRYYTALDLDPTEIHRTGIEQIDRIEAEAKPIADRLFGPGEMAEHWQKLRQDSVSRFASRQEVVDSAEAAVARARAALPKWFGRLPRAEMIVDPCLEFEEKSGCPNSYQSPAQDGSRPGRWRVNTNPDYASRVDLESIAFHEGYPGHHVGDALNQERTDAHPVTRILGSAGFAEGWGLYAEDLASEMGLYSGDLAQLGRLSSAAFRAARLVVDPGLHVLGWSRERAIDYMLAHTAVSRETATSEVDRYIILPGQATAYMIGRLEIGRLRAEAERRLGRRFDIRAFHDQVLANGNVPLPFLREQIESWIATEGTP